MTFHLCKTNTLGIFICGLLYSVLFQVEGWTHFQTDLDNHGIDGSRIYTVVFIALGHFIFTNVFIGVIIMNISEATEAYKVSQATSALRNGRKIYRRTVAMFTRQSDVRETTRRATQHNLLLPYFFTNNDNLCMKFSDTRIRDDAINASANHFLVGCSISGVFRIIRGC